MTTINLLDKSESHIPIPPVSGTSMLNVSKPERMASAVGGGLLISLGGRQSFLPGTLLVLLGGYLVYRGASGYCPLNKALHRDTATGEAPLIQAASSITINKPVDEIYTYWRKLENLPKFMKHVKSVQHLHDQLYHWEVNFPKLKKEYTWDAEILEEVPNERITWCSKPGVSTPGASTPGASVDNAGEVYFREAPGHRGTEVQVTLSYRPPVGDLGGMVGQWLNPAFKQMIREDLRRFKHFMETGEHPTLEGQPSGRKL